MMQEMTRHPRHLGMELVEHKLHLQRLLWRLLWRLMRRCTTPHKSSQVRQEHRGRRR